MSGDSGSSWRYRHDDDAVGACEEQAVAAARAAFIPWSQTPVEKRLAIMGKIAEIYQRRIGEVAETISEVPSESFVR